MAGRLDPESAVLPCDGRATPTFTTNERSARVASSVISAFVLAWEESVLIRPTLT